MGMYTEFIFQGQTKKYIPTEIKKLLYYFFDENALDLIDGVKLPVHDFFKCERWRQIGHMSSYYFNPFALRNIQNHVRETGKLHVFLRCDLKNYDDEIIKFIDWINPYMSEYWGYHLYEENEFPVFFKIFNSL